MFTPKENSELPDLPAEEADGDIHTMPDQFRQNSMQPPQGKRLNWLVLGIVIFLALGGVIAGVIWFLNKQSEPMPIVELPVINTNANENVNDNSNDNNNSNNNANTNSNDTLSTASSRDAKRLNDIGDIRSALNLYAGTYQVFPNSLSNLVGPFMEVLPTNPEPGGQSYLYSSTAEQKGYLLAFALEADAVWGTLKLAAGDYVATAEVIFPASQLEEQTNEEVSDENPGTDLPSTPTVPQTPAKGQDSDGDQLTDIEENIFQTDSAKADTDNDGYVDASEILNFFNPKGDGRLVDSGLIGIYQNPSYNYSVFYPVPWPARSLNIQNSEVIFTSNTGEFIEVIVQENPLGLSAKNWYLDKNKSADAAALKSVLVGGLPAIQTPDGLNTYLAVGSSIYVLVYDTGNQQQMNFYTTYQLFLKSFIFIEPKTE
ncbi:MAG: hypothetical protein Q8P32_03600 [Candidatus Komeilibacteria bacterium]|nr:hypothetical protein [Candidatus Komeilibacteria bacterium]